MKIIQQNTRVYLEEAIRDKVRHQFFMQISQNKFYQIYFSFRLNMNIANPIQK